MTPRRVVSGGQTGVDRGALDAALILGFDCGGWCPRGRRAEDGAIPDRYPLVETTSHTYAERTRRNVLDADATLVVTRGRPGRGTALTVRLAGEAGRPVVVVDLARDEQPRARIRGWLDACEPRVLNVAGPRESHRPGIAEATRLLLLEVLGA